MPDHGEDKAGNGADPLWGRALAFWFSCELDRNWKGALLSLVFVAAFAASFWLLAIAALPGLLPAVLLWLTFVVFLSKPLDLLCGCGGIIAAAILGLITAVFVACLPLLHR